MEQTGGSVSPVLSVENLTTSFRVDGGWKSVVRNMSFEIAPRETVAIVGESGSGKSVTSLSIMRLLDKKTSRIEGKVMLGGRNLLALPEEEMRKVRGKDISMIFQEPMTSLNPIFPIGKQIAEALTVHQDISSSAAKAEVIRLLEKVRIPNAKNRFDDYPHQFSGGMRQRVMIAMALASRPKLLIADEPTTALDVTIQGQILDLIKTLQEEEGTSVLFITHDMGVVAEMADDVVVMWKGKKVEEGPVKDIFANPQHPYTRALLSAVPRLGSMTGEEFPKRLPLTVLQDGQPVVVGEERVQNTAKYDEKPLLSVRDLFVRFDIRKNLFGKATHRCSAVQKVSFDIHAGETLALVGESGSGKSTIGRTIQQLQSAVSGEISFNGRSYSEMSAAERFRMRQEVQYIFQDPFASLDPRKTVGFSIAEPINTHGLINDQKAVRRRVDELLERVGLSSEHASRYPHEFSGGQRQRVCIARALASDPKLIIADEALSALDVSIQAQIINLFMDLQAERGLAYLFISHDM
ncbi:MAG TPA: glutathione ABC transporter ATP-binding protein GsiA, partial [Agrobacterium sp.]|nr:glutathione ABC transporter ATP-binding protein GsiA [Agrobacterium sp.]